MHLSDLAKYLSLCNVTTFLICTILAYLSLSPCILESLEACCFIPCPLSLEGHRSLHEYCLSSLSRTSEFFGMLHVTITSPTFSEQFSSPSQRSSAMLTMTVTRWRRRFHSNQRTEYSHLNLPTPAPLTH